MKHGNGLEILISSVMAKDQIGAATIKAYYQSLRDIGYSHDKAVEKVLDAIKNILLEAPWTLEELEKVSKGIRSAIHKSKG